MEAVRLKILSVKEYPEIKDNAIEYISSKWSSVSRIIYDDCISHCMTTSAALPQWYILVKEDEWIGCAGLITNDFISRMDLYPWLCSLYIEECHRGHSYGRLLIERAIQDTKNTGFQNLYLSTEHVGYYEKYGFKYLGIGYHPWDEESRIYGITL
ncbi:GNAT family N-acetyltransferase [Gabonibacter chumensis]|uniref:GNAT family N-acetyltransferase n=1 Tax=Gabonibacter chumensis TaxID=2972474 RepID=UPI0025736893|nr:GNAT family N-acetyltransferase [Gabonibacter chumensis]MCR9012973.1 GNAT family N-acetyltransferase [Gabonibacter chumensis]